MGKAPAFMFQCGSDDNQEWNERIYELKFLSLEMRTSVGDSLAATACACWLAKNNIISQFLLLNHLAEVLKRWADC